MPSNRKRAYTNLRNVGGEYDDRIGEIVFTICITNLETFELEREIHKYFDVV